MPDARTEAVEAMAHAACTPGEPGSCDLCKENAALQLDAIPTAVLAALLLERGGLVPSVWEEPADQTPMGVSEPEYYPYDPDDEDAIDAADQLGHVLLYRLSDDLGAVTCPHVVTSGEGTSFCSLAAAGPPAILYCPNCGINRPWGEYGGDELETVGDDAVDHWPGTGMGLACPRCGVEAAPVTADGFVDRYARQWRPRPPRRGASNGSPPYTLTTVTVWDDVSPEPATEDGDR